MPVLGTKKKSVEPKLHVFFLEGGGWRGLRSNTNYHYEEAEDKVKNDYASEITKKTGKKLEPSAVEVTMKMSFTLEEAFGAFMETPTRLVDKDSLLSEDYFKNKL
jgi:hypothetical protein